MPKDIQEPTVKFEITGENLNYSQNISPKTALELISLLVTGGRDIKKTSGQKKTRISAAKSTDSSNLIQELGISSDGSRLGLPGYYSFSNKKSDKILWILAYASKAKKREHLTASEISSIASHLKEHIQAKHVGALIKGARNANRIDPSGGKFRILQPGIDYIEQLGVVEKKK